MKKTSNKYNIKSFIDLLKILTNLIVKFNVLAINIEFNHYNQNYYIILFDFTKMHSIISRLVSVIKTFFSVYTNILYEYIMHDYIINLTQWFAILN